MQKKRKILTKTGINHNFELPISIHGEFEDLHLIEKRKRGGKLRKKDFLVEIIKKGIRQWHNR
jgi:hypothetical protein